MDGLSLSNIQINQESIQHNGNATIFSWGDDVMTQHYHNHNRHHSNSSGSLTTYRNTTTWSTATGCSFSSFMEDMIQVPDLTVRQLLEYFCLEIADGREQLDEEDD